MADNKKGKKVHKGRKAEQRRQYHAGGSAKKPAKVVNKAQTATKQREEQPPMRIVIKLPRHLRNQTLDNTEQ